MKAHLSTFDLAVLIAYAVGVFSLAQFVSRSKHGEARTPRRISCSWGALPRRPRSALRITGPQVDRSWPTRLSLSHSNENAPGDFTWML